MTGCTGCGLPGYSDPKLCPVCTSPAPAHEAYLHDFTAKLGPIRLDPNSQAERARVVREALRAAAMEETGKAHEHLWQAAALASDGTLTKLKRLLKH